MASGAAATRKKASDLTTLTVGGVNVLAKYRDASDTQTVGEVATGAVMDTWKQVRGGQLSGSMEVEVAGEGSDVMNAVFVAGAIIAFTHDIMGTQVTGSGLLVSKGNRTGGIDGAQTQTFTMTVIERT